MRVQFPLQPKQAAIAELLEPGARPVVVGGGGSRGGGKSRLGRNWILKSTMQYENVISYIFRRTMDDLQDNHIIPMLMETPGLQRFWREQKKRLVMPGNRILRFLSAENINDLFRLAGKEAAFIFVDQAEQFTQEELEFLRTLNRWTKNSLVRAKMLWTFNPGGIGAQYLRRVMVQRKFEENEISEDFAFVDMKGWDNIEWARHYLDDNNVGATDYYNMTDEERFQIFVTHSEYGRSLNSLPEDMRQAHLFGNWDTFAGQFFHEWRHQIHVNKEGLKQFPDHVMVAGAIDYGRRSCVHLGLRNETGYTRIFDESYTEDMPPTQRAELCADMIERWALWNMTLLYDTNMSLSLKNYYGSDKTPLDYFREVFRRRMPGREPIMIPVSKRSPDNRNYRAVANETFREYLRCKYTVVGGKFVVEQPPLLTIDPRCAHLIKSIPELQYPPRERNDGLDFDQNVGINDPFDSAKYLVMFLRSIFVESDVAPITSEDDYITRVVVPRIMKKQHHDAYGRVGRHADTL